MKKIVLAAIIATMLSTVSGCSSEERADIKSDYEELISIFSFQNNIDEFEYKGDVQFIPISCQYMKDDTNYAIKMYQYVDLQTGIIYLYTLREKNTTWEKLVNADDTPVIYKDLEGLRTQYNWSEE